MSDLIIQAAMFRRRLEAEQEVTRKWIEHSRNLEKTVEKQRSQISGLQMNSAGLVAQRDFLKAEEGNLVKASALTNELHPDGLPRTFLRVLYDRAFDRRGQELGISNPKEWRS
ncbi:hypothetical protein AD929_02365 [Gluconobacter potus]|uniref:Uncharacterized protein n=1 Tax=Gluconobacter potus TaxID=2724927 RepID=A0A149QZ14_9PROT|nr:hypothetical protein [Gluconobacter potus]KXV02553.1 hypothetical protein AD929_02365 [Gluconobacter potus]